MDYASALGLVRDFCGWHVTPLEVTEVVLDSDGSRLVRLPTLHLVNVLSVKVDGQPATGWEASSDGLLRLASAPPAKLGCIEVSMQHGFESCEIVAAVARSVAARPEGEWAAKSVQVDDAAISYAIPAGFGGAGFTEAEAALLERFRLGPRP